MNKSKATRDTIIVGILSVVLMLVTGFYYHIDKHLTGAIFIGLTLLLPISLIAIFLYAVKGLMQFYYIRQNQPLKFYIPGIVAILTLAYVLSPWQLSSEAMESMVEFRACYEGTQNQSFIKFRADKTFEINSTGAFFYDKWFTGNWRKSGDTIFMNFKNEAPQKIISDTVIIKEGMLVPIGKIDSIKNHFPFYYLGFCKGLN
ncbi:MAG: hypothetical protein V4615_02175 [Bacteroidota bacterium]